MKIHHALSVMRTAMDFLRQAISDLASPVDGEHTHENLVPTPSLWPKPWATASRRLIAAVVLILCIEQAAVASKAPTYYITDPDGTVVATMDAWGQQNSQAVTKPFGAPAGGDNSSFFAGHTREQEAPNVVYMQARYYDAETGRFISVDPIPPSPNGLLNFSRYGYASNNPIGRTDPTGMADECSAACRKLRALSDSMGISGALKSAVGGSSGPMGQAHAGMATVNGELEQAAAGEIAAAAPYADSYPGATAAACFSGADCTNGEYFSAFAVIIPIEIEAAEILALNRAFSTGYAFRSIETVVANMSRRETAVQKAAVAIRDIAGAHLFENGNKRTASQVAARILGDKADPARIKAVVDRAARGDLRTVEEIAHALDH